MMLPTPSAALLATPSLLAQLSSLQQVYAQSALLTASDATSLELGNVTQDSAKKVISSKRAKQHALSASISALAAVPTTSEYVLIVFVLATKTLQDIV